MGLTMEQQQVRDLLTETVTLLCKNGLQFSHELGIEALIGITLDKEDVFLVNIKETIFSERKTFHNSSSSPSCPNDAIESFEFSLVPQTFLGKESFNGTQECGKIERDNQTSYSVVVDSGTDSVTKSNTHENNSGAKKTGVFFEDIDDVTDILEMPRKHRGGSINSRTVEFDQKDNFSISPDSKKRSTSAFINENINCNALEMGSESCVIEMKKEAIDEVEDAENSYMAIGSLYPNSFDGYNDWNWKANHWRPKQMSAKMSSEKQNIQCNSSSSSTPVWNTRSQKSRCKQSHVRTATDVRPDETDARRCPICGMVSLNWNMYLRHIRKHQPGMYRCPFCGKSFSGSTNLRGHLAIHTNIREFTCHLCDKAYAYKKDLSEHLMVKHGQVQSRIHLLTSFGSATTNHGLDIAELLDEENI